MRVPLLASDPMHGPDIETLESRLRSALTPSLIAGRAISVIARAEPPRVGKRYSSELIDVQVGDGRLKLFAKHGSAIDPGDPFLGGMPGGLAYETVAHGVARLLDPQSVPLVYGLYTDRSGSASLFVDRITAQRADAATGRVQIEAYAAWLGRFQAAGSRMRPGLGGGLFSMDRAFLVPWFERSVARMRSLGFGDLPRAAGDRYAEDVEVLASAEPVLVHGDFYSDNVIVAVDGSLRVIDWELAALGPGEIDLAAITLGRKDAEREACVDAYVRERYDGEPPSDFDRVLLAARTHVLLRILSIPPRPERAHKYERRVRTLLQLLGDSG